MIYTDFKEIKLSQLAFGAMRLPVIDGKDENVDVKAAEEMVDYAMDHGINYYDTAWGYHGGNSESVMGKALKKYPRDSYYLATKFPGYDLVNMPKVKEIFEEQIERTGHDFFDFYLFHNVCEMNIEQYLDPQYEIYDHLMAQRKKGRIKYLGFSCHGSYDVLKRFLEAYGDDMEFCQLQINYLDWEFQDGKRKVELLREYDIPLWVMEPLRGGKLAKVDERYEKRFKALRAEESVPAWAFRFLQSLPETKTILSGMSNMEQLKENVEIFEKNAPLNEDEMTELLQIADEMSGEGSVPCTACHYCTDHCPVKLDIPELISLYNEHKLTTEAGNFGFIAPMVLGTMAEDKRPEACLDCKSCEKVCPQQIEISKVMKDFAERVK